MIRAVTFDLDGVYFTAESFKNFKTNLPKSTTDEVLLNSVLYTSNEMKAFKRGELAEDAYWDFARQQLGITVDNPTIFKILADSYQVNPEVQNYVRMVRTQGMKTCICSNNFITRIRELDAKFDFLKDFDVHIFSFDVGILKPDKGIFQALVDKLGMKPHEIIYADDDSTKLRGALQTGLNAFVYKGFDHFKLRVDALSKMPEVAENTQSAPTDPIS